MKRVLTLSVWLLLVLGLFWFASASYGEKVSKEHLTKRHSELKVLSQSKKAKGYDITETERLIVKARKAFQRGNLKEADNLLNDAFNALESLDKRTDSSARKSDKVIFSESPFAVAYGEIYKNETFMPYLKELGVNRTKLYLHWYWIEPQNNKYDWRLVDTFLNQMKDDDEVLIAVFTSSKWGAEGVGKGFPPRDYDEYYNFIYDLVKHCKGRVKYWQRDTEPASPRHWDKKKSKEYVKTQKYFYKAVKDADPNALVIDVSMNGVFNNGKPQSADFFDYVLKNAKDFFDILDIRLYWNIYDIPSRVDWFKKKMEMYGYTKPIVTTEYGGPTPAQFPEFKILKKKYAKIINIAKDGDSKNRLEAWKAFNKDRGGFPPSMQMFLKDAGRKLEEKRHRINSRDLVQRTVVAMTAGVEKLWYWNLTSRWHPTLGPHPIFGKLSLIDGNFNKRSPAFFAYKLMVEKIKGIKSIEQIPTEDGNIYLFRVEKWNGKMLYILWEKRDIFSGEDEPATPFEFPFNGKKINVTDVFGNQEIEKAKGGKILIEVTGTPVYIELIDT